MKKKLLRGKSFNKNHLMNFPIREINFQLEKSWVWPYIEQVLGEIKQKGIPFKPHFWISDEWFSPDGIPGVAVPFYLLDKSLLKLEKIEMGEAEGEKPQELLKIIRHEIAHAIDNAYHLRKIKRRQKLFGLTSTPYPESYDPDLKSKDFVSNVGHGYGQAHPDEDWAETFAVWLDPNSNWEKKYAKWPALKKLQMVEEIMEGIKGKRPIVQNKRKLGELKTSSGTIGDLYRSKKATSELNKSYLTSDFSKVFKAKKNKSSSCLYKLVKVNKRKIINSCLSKTVFNESQLIQIVDVVENSLKNSQLFFRGPDKDALVEVSQLIEKNQKRYLKKGIHRILM